MSSMYQSVGDVYKKLESIPMFGNKGAGSANFSLEAIRSFCHKLGNPQDSFPSIHVAGTNGKGTTCRMLASICESAGYKTGLYTSPHLTDYRERFIVNGKWISEDQLLEFFQVHEQLIEKNPLTYFELSTAVAFWFFARTGVDIAIIETGLGGRLDATNIITPIASVITSIGLDHTDILGNTLQSIAREKAGIVKPGIPVVIGRLPEEAEAEVKVAATNKGSGVFVASPSGRIKFPGLENQNQHQYSIAVAMNQEIVRTVLRCVSEELPVSSSSIEDGLSKWSDRYPAGVSFQLMHSTYPWYFDGAHNIDALRLLNRQMILISPLKNWTMVVSLMKDKLTEDVSAILSEIGELYYCKIDSERALSVEMAKRQLPGVKVLESDHKLPSEWVQKYKSELVIFGGSFYFYRTVKRWMENIADE